MPALRFASEKHRDQRRRDREASPYVNHLIVVLETLWTVGGVRDPRVLAAGVLHDSIEDTETTAEELQERFGSEVAAIVLEVTDDKSLPKMTRKELQVERAASASFEARLIKLADKISNVSDLIHSPPANWTVERKRDYALWAERVVNRLRGTNPALEALFDDLCSQAKRLYA
jgi:guanosine-3',5'-bis(diphosphate) 3'-pyrophosphohydrolase